MAHRSWRTVAKEVSRIAVGILLVLAFVVVVLFVSTLFDAVFPSASRWADSSEAGLFFLIVFIAWLIVSRLRAIEDRLVDVQRRLHRWPKE